MLESELSFFDALHAFVESGYVPDVRSRYNEPWRHYHDWSHPINMKDHLLEAEVDGVKLVDGAAALAFILWHDAIYDPKSERGRNEYLSAQLCSHSFSAFGHPTSVKRASNCILTTIHHQALYSDNDTDNSLLLDIDLAIFGAAPEVFDLYHEGIAAEYDHIPQPIYQIKRKEVLQSFLKRDRIYLTDWAHTKWDLQARENLTRVCD